MPQLLLPDNIPPLVRASSTTCTLAATNMGMPTRITIAGQQYRVSSLLTLNTATTGLGGLDTGALSNTHDLYYVYACANSSGVVGLVASLVGPTTGPSGFTTRYKLVGAFYSKDSGNQIGSTVTITGQASTDWTSYNAGVNNVGSKVYTVTADWKREGDHCRFRVYLFDSTGVASGVATSTLVAIFWPDGFDADYNKLPGTGSTDGAEVGTWWSNGVYTGAGAINPKGPFIAFDADRGVMRRNWDGTGFATTSLRISDLNVARVQNINVEGSIPVIGWSKTLLG
jgi:hypothetical protein